MTIQAETTDTDWRWVVPEGYCYSCAYTHHAGDPTDTPDVHTVLAAPESPNSMLGAAAYEVSQRLGLPVKNTDWRPAHVEAVQALIAMLQDRIYYGELGIRRTAENA